MGCAQKLALVADGWYVPWATADTEVLHDIDGCR